VELFRAPGPGQYNPDLSKIKSSSGAGMFPQSQRTNLAGNSTKSPGPGHVTITSDWDKIKRLHGWMSLDPKRGSDRGASMLSKENVPGPGTYTTKDGSVAKRGPAYSIYARYGQKHDE